MPKKEWKKPEKCRADEGKECGYPAEYEGLCCACNAVKHSISHAAMRQRIRAHRPPPKQTREAEGWG